MASDLGNYETPCPHCGGTVQYWYFDSDCRGNDGGSGIQCKGCGINFKAKEWNAVARMEKEQDVNRRRVWFSEDWD